MPIEVRRAHPDRMAELLVPISTTFGLSYSAERVERARGVPEIDTIFAGFDDDTIVGTAAAFAFEMTVPGGVAVPTAGVTAVAVMPTYRRQGILRSMMRSIVDNAHDRGQPLAALFASEGGIYGRFGFGVTCMRGAIEVRKERASMLPSRDKLGSSRVRLVESEPAAAACSQIWESVRLARPGMVARSPAWWRVRRTPDPDGIRAGRPPLQRAILEVEAAPRAYALYRYSAPFTGNASELQLEVMECFGDSAASTRAIWSYLFSLDLVRAYRAPNLPVDHPLVLMLAEPAALRMQLEDGLWVKLVDVGAALSQRRYGAGDPVVFEVTDTFCPWNAGRWRLADGTATRSDAPADLALDVSALGAAYLGSVSFAQMAGSGRVDERRPRGLARADALFRASLQPWAPEIF